MEEVIEKPVTQTIISDAFDGSDTPPAEATAQQQEKPPADIPNTADIPLDKSKETPLPEDGRSFLKEKLGYEDWDAAKAEIEALRTKPQPAAEVVQEPISVDKIKEAYAIIDKKERLDALTDGEVTKNNAPEIIKAAMVEKYKLSKEQVNYKFNKQFAAPKEPKQDEASGESDEDFVIRKSEWQQQVADIEMDMLIEANIVRPDLEKIKSEIVLPTIAGTAPTNKPPTPEDLAKAQKDMELFVQNAGAAVSKFEGFKVAYKDNDVNIQSTYSLSYVEKASVLGQMKLLAEKDYDTNALFAERWVNDDRTYNFERMANDLAILENHDKASQKFASDIATKAKLEFIKGKHQIDLGNQEGGQLQLEDKNAQQKNEDAIWN